MTRTSRTSGKTARPGRAEGHSFAVGQMVRMSGGFTGLNARIGDLYQVTGQLPPNGSGPQYRIRNDAEIYERVASENNLEPAEHPSTEPLIAERASSLPSAVAAAGSHRARQP